MKPEKVLEWLKEQLPQARERFKGLYYQPKGHIKMELGPATRATAFVSQNLIVWGRRYLIKATGEELLGALAHELLHLALPEGVHHKKLFKQWAAKLGIEMFSKVSLRPKAEQGKRNYQTIHPLIAHRCKSVGKRGEWKVIYKKAAISPHALPGGE